MPCHLPFLLPVAGLLLFAVLPFPVALALYVPLTALSLAMAIPAVRAMYRPTIAGAESLLGKQAIVVAAADSTGTARCDGALWACRSPEPLAPEQPVCVVSVRGLVLTVEPFPTRSPLRRRHP